MHKTFHFEKDKKNYDCATKYCCKWLLLFLFFSFLNADDSICLTLSRLTPIISPISCNVFILPSSIPNLHRITCFSLVPNESKTFSKSCLMNCFIRISSDVSASGSDITSCIFLHTHLITILNKKEDYVVWCVLFHEGQTEGLRFRFIPIFWSSDLGGLGESRTAMSLFNDSPVASATSSFSGCLPFSVYNCFRASFTRYVASTM